MVFDLGPIIDQVINPVAEEPGLAGGYAQYRLDQKVRPFVFGQVSAVPFGQNPFYLVVVCIPAQNENFYLWVSPVDLFRDLQAADPWEFHIQQ